MLQAIRGSAGSWIVKILFFFIAASFVTWGAGDFVRGRITPSAVATVGGTEITPEELEVSFRNEVRQLQSIYGTDFTVQDAAEAGMLRESLLRLVRGTLWNAEAEALLLQPSTALIADMVRMDPRFRDQLTGQFSRAYLESVLRANRISEAQLIQIEQQRIARETVSQTVARGSYVPDTMVDALFRHLFQTRDVEAAVVRHSLVAAPEDPEEQVLQAFYQERANSYLAPEFRVLTVLELTPDLLADSFEISEEDLLDAYEMRVAGMQAVEARGFTQVVVQDEALATAIADAATADGLDLAEAAARAVGEGATPPRVIEVPPSRRADLPTAALGELVFGLDAPGAVGGPVRSPFGWHVVRLSSVESEPGQDFESLRAELEREILWDLSANRLYELANAVEDQLAGGATLEEASQALNIPLVTTPPLSSAGRDPDGATYDGLQILTRALAEAFTQSIGRTGRMIETVDGLFAVVRVDEVIESAVRPFDTVRDQVLADWRDDRRAAEASQIALELAEAVAGGADLEDLARAHPAVGFVTVEGLGREGARRGDLPMSFVSLVFSSAIDETVVAPGDGVEVVGRAVAVTEIGPDDRPDAASGLAEQIQAQIQSDLQAEFLNALERKYDVRIDENALATIRFDG